MAKENQHPNLSSIQYYTIPFENPDFMLTKEILKKHHENRSVFHYYSYDFQVRKLDFKNEVLIVAVKLKNEPEERIYLKVTSSALLVSCSVDTHQDYLGLYAYNGLSQLIGHSSKYDFSNYYWPGFFSTERGASKYLDIGKDNFGVYVTLKSTYHSFIKPGCFLPEIKDGRNVQYDRLPPLNLNTIFDANEFYIGYCIAYDWNESKYRLHLPFLVPYYGYLTKNGENTKIYKGYITDDINVPLVFTSGQLALNNSCYEMMKSCEIQMDSKDLGDTVMAQKIKVLSLWHSVIETLAGEKIMYSARVGSLKWLKLRPTRRDMVKCSFGMERPELVFELHNKEGHYQIELFFKINGIVSSPSNYRTPHFFISGIESPSHFYLINSLQDYEVFKFFKKTNFKVNILKAHYMQFFRNFIEQLGNTYTLNKI